MAHVEHEVVNTYPLGVMVDRPAQAAKAASEAGEG